MASLQDQLLKAGVVNKGQAQRVRKEKQKKRKQNNSASREALDAAQLAAQAREEKKQKDQARNRELNAQAQRKAELAAAQQLIEAHKVFDVSGESAYQFVHNQKIKKLYLTPQTIDQLSAGRLAIVESGQRYQVVPVEVLGKLQSLVPEQIVVNNQSQPSDEDDDDYYAQYKIPDDLDW